MDIVTQNLQTVHFEELTDSGQTVEASSGHSDTEPTDGTVSGTDRQYKTAVDIVKHNEETVEFEILTDSGHSV